MLFGYGYTNLVTDGFYPLFFELIELVHGELDLDMLLEEIRQPNLYFCLHLNEQVNHEGTCLQQDGVCL